jgi:hypothetical protein
MVMDRTTVPGFTAETTLYRSDKAYSLMLGGRRPGDLLVPDPARAVRASGCAATIQTRYGTYHLVDEGVGADGWHYCGYEPGAYGVFDDGDLVPYP